MDSSRDSLKYAIESFHLSNNLLLSVVSTSDLILNGKMILRNRIRIIQTVKETGT